MRVAEEGHVGGSVGDRAHLHVGGSDIEPVDEEASATVAIGSDDQSAVVESRRTAGHQLDPVRRRCRSNSAAVSPVDRVGLEHDQSSAGRATAPTSSSRSRVRPLHRRRGTGSAWRSQATSTLPPSSAKTCNDTSGLAVPAAG